MFKIFHFVKWLYNINKWKGPVGNGLEHGPGSRTRSPGPAADENFGADGSQPSPLLHLAFCQRFAQGFASFLRGVPHLMTS